MLVERIPIKDLPKGARILSEKEVLEYYNNHIFGTTHSSDVWYLRYGFCIAGCTTFVTNYYLVDYYRRRCRIYGFAPSLITSLCFVAVPSALALLFHYTECRQRILLSNLCINCLYGRAAVYQNLFGVLYGMVPSALGCLTFANMMNTYSSPGFGGIKEMKGSYEVWKKFTKRRIPAICLFFALHTAIITHVTKNELEDKYRLDEILKMQSEKLKTVAEHYKKKE